MKRKSAHTTLMCSYQNFKPNYLKKVSQESRAFYEEELIKESRVSDRVALGGAWTDRKHWRRCHSAKPLSRDGLSTLLGTPRNRAEHFDHFSLALDGSCDEDGIT